MPADLNPFGFLITDPKFPLAHAQRTSFMDKMRAVWTVMHGHPVRLDKKELDNVLKDWPLYWSLFKKKLVEPFPVGLVDYLTLRIVWGPILHGLLLFGSKLASLVVQGFVFLGKDIKDLLEKSEFGNTILGKGLKFIVWGVTELLEAAIPLIFQAPIIVFAPVIVARMAVAAVLTAACLPFTLLAHGLSKLSGREAKNAVLKCQVNYRGNSSTLEKYLAEKKLSLDDLFLKQKPNSPEKFSVMIKNREGNLGSTGLFMFKLCIGIKDQNDAEKNKLLATFKPTKEPNNPCEINLEQDSFCSRSHLNKLQIPMISRP